jgi:trigger factor
LKIETQFLEDHQAKLIVEIEDERLEEMKRRAAGKLAKRVKIPGFRPGKAPYHVVVRTIGDGAIFEEALELLVDEVYPEAIKQAGIDPYGPGKLENVSNTDPFTLEFVIPLDAVVELGDYKAIRKDYEPKPVTEEDVEKSLDALRERHVIIEPVDRPGAEGDVVTIRLEAKIQKDEGDESLLEERSIPVKIEAGNSEEWPFQGFSMNLVGKSAGDHGTIEHAFPEDYAEESLQNATAKFDYEVESVKSRLLPELNDEFATSVGEFENLEALRLDVRKMLESQADEEYNQTYDEEVIDEAISLAKFDYPPQMLENEVIQVMDELKKRLERQNLDLEIYLKSRQIDEKALQDELKPVAEKRLKRSLLLFELGRAENIEVGREELESEAGTTLDYLQRILPQKDARRLRNRDVQNNVVNNVLVDLLTRKTVERLRKIANGRLESPEAPTPENEAEAEASAIVADTDAPVDSGTGTGLQEESKAESLDEQKESAQTSSTAEELTD